MSTKEMKKIIDLPDLVLPIIFKELSIQDLLTCRLVNKLFKHFSDHSNGINRLIIGQPVDEVIDYYWYYNYKLIEDKDIISLKCFRTIQKLSIFNLDKNLKYLKIYDHQYEFKLNEISNLINLQSIEFGHYYDDDNQQILNLPNLKVFVSNLCSFQLNTPKLEKIQFNDINKIKLNSNTESIKHLITCNYDNKLEIFKNLEIMELKDTNQPVMNENLLSLFKNLKQLKINLNYQINYSNELIKNSLIKILNDKIKLKRSIDIYLEGNLLIYRINCYLIIFNLIKLFFSFLNLKGVKIENIDKFNELVSTDRYPYWKFRLNNYDLLDLNLPFIRYLNYGELEECVNNIKNDLPSSFFDKFFNIYYVIVKSLNDVNGLNWFLNKLNYLNRLEIDYNVSLGQVFYNNLPNTIEVLHIYSSENINYEFILKLSKLIRFQTEVDKDLFDLVFTSFLNLNYLNRFTFYYKKKKIEIERNDKYFYLDCGRKELNYNQLKEEFNQIRQE